MEHKTARGKPYNMAMVAEQYKDKPALSGLGGITRMNAGGDILGKNGNIILKRKDIMEQYYKENTNRVQKMAPSDLGKSQADFGKPVDLAKTPMQILAETRNQQEAELLAMQAELSNNPDLLKQEEVKRPMTPKRNTPPTNSVMASAPVEQEISDKEKKLKE